MIVHAHSNYTCGSARVKSMQQLLIVLFISKLLDVLSFSFSSLRSTSEFLSLCRLTQVPNLGVSPRSWIETILLLSCQKVSDVAELENESKACLH